MTPKQFARIKGEFVRQMRGRAVSKNAGDTTRALLGELLECHREAEQREPLSTATMEAMLADKLSDGSPDLRVGRYRLLREIGSGATSRVFEAQQERPRRVVALKLIIPRSADARSVAAIFNEADTLSRLRHPGIVHVYDAGLFRIPGAEFPFIVTELVEGLPLLEHARQKRLSSYERMAMLAEVCEAIAHAHAKGIVHRDIKPHNILVDQTGRVRVIDFGLAQTTEPPSCADAELVGTLSYMSPEQAAYGTVVSTSSDVYALGALGYELLTSRKLLRLDGLPIGESLQRVRTARRDVDPLAAAHPGLAAAIAQATRLDPMDRQPSAESLRRDLLRAIGVRPRRELHPVAPPTTAALFGVVSVMLLVWVGALSLAPRVQPPSQTALEYARAYPMKTSSRLLGVLSKFEYHEGNLPKAVRIAEEAYADTVAAHGRRSPEAHRARFWIAQRLVQLDDPRAEPMLRELIVAWHALPGDHSFEANLARLTLADFLRGSGEAVQLVDQVISGSPEWRYDNRCARRRLAHRLIKEGALTEAESQLSELLSFYAHPANTDIFEQSVAQELLAGIYWLHGDYEGAEALFRTCHASRLKKFPGDHLYAQGAARSIGVCLRDRGLLEAATPWIHGSYSVTLATLGPDHPSTADAMATYATLLLFQGQANEADELAEQCHSVRRDRALVRPADVAEAALLRAFALLQLGQPDRALTFAREAGDLYSTAMGDGAWQTSLSRACSVLCQRLGVLSRTDRAVVRGAITDVRAERGDRHPWATLLEGLLKRSQGIG